MTYHPLTHKCRIYPHPIQIKKFEITLDACQFLYNNLLKQYKNDYKNNNVPKNIKEYLSDLCEQNQKTYKSISKLDASTIKDVSNSIIRAIKLTQNPGNLKEKTQNRKVKSFLINNNTNIQLKGNILHLDNYGKFKLYYGKTIRYCKVISYRVLYQNTKWYILITIRSDNIEIFPKTGKKVGLDLGINNILTLSNGKKYSPPEISKTNEKIDKLNTKLSSKKRGSRKHNEIIEKINILYNHRRNTINDHFHKITTQLVKEYDIIAMENLDIHNMLKDRRYSKGIFHSNWYKLLNMLKYKCELYGKIFIQVNRRFPSTKLCNNCGYKYEDITIDVRMWECPECGEIHDRDVNAAKNILQKALIDN